MAIAELSDEDLVAFLYEDQGGSALDVINDVNEIFSAAQNDQPIPNDAPASLNELIESVAQEVGAHVEEVFGSTSTGPANRYHRASVPNLQEKRLGYAKCRAPSVGSCPTNGL